MNKYQENKIRRQQARISAEQKRILEAAKSHHHKSVLSLTNNFVDQLKQAWEERDRAISLWTQDSYARHLELRELNGKIERLERDVACARVHMTEEERYAMDVTLATYAFLPIKPLTKSRS